MGNISFTNISDGTTADGNDVNTPLNTIYTEFNGNIDNTNIKTGAAIATSKLADDAGITGAKIAQGAVGGSNLATSAITLGYAQIVANQSGITSSTGVQITSLTAPVTVPVGGRRVKITVFISNSSNTGNNTNTLQIWDGTVGSGALLGSAVAKNRTATDATGFMTAIAVVTPAPGAKTYNAGFAVDGNSGTVVASATAPAFILVEAI